MELSEFEQRASTSNALAGADETRAVNAAMFGLASETGALLDIQKKLLTADIHPDTSDEQIKQELGDLLWYVTRVANAKGFTLEEVAQANLERVNDLWEPPDASTFIAGMVPYDSKADPQERFPRRMTFEFRRSTTVRGSTEHQSAIVKIIAADPNPFPDGAIRREGSKPVGFTLGEVIGDELTDNSRKVDGYRYHDAIHIAFMATLNWSATMRAALRVKRKTTGDADEFEDSARPIFLEEGLAAVLAGLAPRRMNFAAPSNVDGDTLAAARACTDGFEVHDAPGWLWRRAIVAGFDLLHTLEEHGGGLVHADLDARSVRFEPLSD